MIENSHQYLDLQNMEIFGIPHTVDHDGEFIDLFVLNLSFFRYLFVSRLSPFHLRHCCTLINFTVDRCKMAVDENPHQFWIPRTIA